MSKKTEIKAGTRSGHLTYVGEAGTRKDKSGNSKRMIQVRCDCGKEYEMVAGNFLNGHSTSCGCTRRVTLEPGTRIGNLTYVEEAGTNGRNERLVTAKCDYCGREFTISFAHFRKGTQKSCGCAKGRLVSDANTTHGMTNTPLFSIWSGMKSRCTNPNSSGWKNYGARGIIVCDRWLHSFENFFEDMGPTWSPGLTLDRVDVDGPYCKDNCRWSTMKQQNNNKRNTRIVETIDGPMAFEYALESSSVSRSKLNGRLKSQYPAETILEDIDFREHLIDTPDGPMSVRQAARVYNINEHTLENRLLSNCPMDKLFSRCRNNVRMVDTPKGRMAVSKAEQEFGFKEGELSAKLDDGCTPMELFGEPVRKERTIETPDGEMTYAEASKVSGISKSTLKSRIRMGCPVQKLFDPPRVGRPSRTK